MSFQWTLIATFLYVEIAVVVLLLFPFISAQRWQKLFRSRFLQGLGQQIHLYYYIILALLILCLLDAIREMNKYHMEDGKVKEHHHQHLEQELRNHMVLFRAQRNFYITGFSLFLVFVIRRLTTLLMIQATLAATSEAALRQASSATQAAQQLLSQHEGEEMSQDRKNELKEEVDTLNKQLVETKTTLSVAVKDLEAMRSQAESVSREYDRLMEEHTKLQKRLAILDGDGSDKKMD